MTDDEYHTKILELLERIASALESLDTNAYRIAKQYP
jgi:hypothetical protein